MTYSRQPWTARGHDLLDADGRCIAIFQDPRDMDLLVGGFPSQEDFADLSTELDRTYRERDVEARAVNAAVAKLDAVAMVLQKVQPPTGDYATPRPWFPNWGDRSLTASASLRQSRIGTTTFTVARFEAVNDLDFVVRSLDAIKAIREALEDEAVVTPEKGPS